jgi:hypothetical protein
MVMEQGVAKMRPVEGGLEIKPGETVELKPGSFHVMLMGLKQPLRKGEKVKGTSEFEVDIEYAVEALADRGRTSSLRIVAGHGARRALRAMAAAAINPIAASGRPTYQRSRSRPRVRR